MADQFATVSKVSTRVADNGINTLAQQLNEWEQDLKAREAALVGREEVADTTNASRPVVVYVTVIGSLLLILILLNFYLDWRRRE
jgi:CHASE3 domain sensor protein